MHFTESETADLGRAVLRGEVVGCPTCNARLLVERSSHMGVRTERVFLYCKPCRKDGLFSPEAVADSWTPQQAKAIIDGFRRDRIARCPEDQSILNVIEDPTLGSSYLDVTCPLCGRTATSPSADR